MSGLIRGQHIQHRKGRQDAKRGKIFTKAAKEIIIAAKGGGDPCELLAPACGHCRCQGRQPAQGQD